MNVTEQSGMLTEERISESSYLRTRRRFDSSGQAAKYDARYQSDTRDRREQRCILSALDGLPADGAILDMACGAGRLTATLVERGLIVTGADVSRHMIACAEARWRRACEVLGYDTIRAHFDVRDIMCTGYEDGRFDAIVCNRLFHHFIEPEVRRAALSELRRVSAGPIVVSFFNSFALGSVRLWFLRTFWRKHTRDRIPISLADFARDGAAVGLRLVRAIATRWGISPQWYGIFRRKT